MKSIIRISAIAIFLLMSTINIAYSMPEADFSDEVELRSIHELSRQLGLKPDKIEREGSEYNFLAVKSENLLVSRRLDSRTYFVQDHRYGLGKPAGIFQGRKEDLNGACEEMLAKLRIPANEIREKNALEENLQAGRLDPKTRKIEAERPEIGRLLIRCTRQIEGIPVFSSYLKLGFTKEKSIGFMELHWPVIPEGTIQEAHRLQYKVKHDWKVPEQKGAKVEAVEAGIIHSAATGFLMDIYPAIRVIYAPENPEMGRKLMLHFDRHGKPVPNPREFDLPCDTPMKRMQK